ncbi:MAG: hypothetical protein ACLQAT_03795 [Candidatus Binataceae bacterium]
MNLRIGTYFLHIYQVLIALQDLIGIPPPPSGKGAWYGGGLGQPIGTLPEIETKPLRKLTIDELANSLALISRDASELDLSHTADRLTHITEYVSKQDRVDFVGDQRLKIEIEILEQSLIDDLKKQRIFLPDREKFLKYYNKSYGDEVDNAFPQAVPEIRSAANCYVYDEPTASVFHSMRAAEYGLRALARRVLGSRTKFEKLEWGPIIRDLGSKIEAMNAPRTPGTPKTKPKRNRQKLLDFYSDARAQCVYFKGIRDAAMHTRANYEGTDALKALIHVEEFMALLAKNGLRFPVKLSTN